MRETRVLSALAALVAGATLTMASPATATGTTTTTQLTSSANPSTAGQPVTLTATVTGNAPVGQVVFGEPGVTLGSADLTAGVATLVVSSLSVGAHAITATYSGDESNDYSVGTLTQTVAGPTTPTTPVAPVAQPEVKLVASTTKAEVGDRVQLRWRTKYADTVVASGDWSGAQKAAGSAKVRVAERGKHVFELTVQNASGTKTAKVTVMASRKAKVLELEVTDELTMVETEVEVTADGLAKGEEFTIRLDGKVLLAGKANKKGDVDRSFEVAKSTPEGALPLTITGSNPNRVGSAVLNVIKAKKLDVQVVAPEINRREKQAVSVTGLAPGETVTVMYAGEKLTVGTADASGEFMYDFGVGKVTGERTVKVIGADPSRNGEATFIVLGPNGEGSGGGGGGGDEPPTQL